jgi:hypothetical protein
MIEAGLLNDDWWRKLDQVLMYVPGLKMFTKPFLFVVLTMDVNRDDPDSIHGGRMGAFLIAPRSEGDTPRHLAGFRMTLLRRDETTDLVAVFGALGENPWRCVPFAKVERSPLSYHYLGPSCCRIGASEVRCGRCARVFSEAAVVATTQPSMFYPPSPSPTTASHRSSSAETVGGPPSV